MNREKITTLWPVLLILVAALWVGGCSESPTNVNETDSTNLVDDFGGYNIGPEEPGFGDDDLMADDELEVEVDDPLLSSPEITALTSDPESGLFHLRVIWGQIPLDTTATDPIDWSGSLTISRGAEVLRRLIRFEPVQDYPLERTDPQLIEWVSQTTIHNDGIAVDLFVPPPQPTLDSAGEIIDTLPLDPVTVTFETGPYSRTFTLPELAALDTIVELDSGAKVAFHAIWVPRVPCPGGFVTGGWGYDEEGQGRFRGRWMSYRGDILGWLNGHFGQDDDGANVLFGKWINRNGDCKGFIKGTYERTRSRCGDYEAGNRCGNGGEFHTRVFDADRNPIGQLHGKYQDAPERKNGFFQGRWRLNCNRDSDHNSDYDDGLDPLI